MKFLNLKDFGSVLTGRDFGRTVFQSLSQNLDHPVGLNFAGVESMGSSFGDEIIIPIARAQGNKIYVKYANSVVWSCLRDIAEDGKIDVNDVQ
jgi:STAS-like domain of unknown function (DUF4325)